MADVQHQQHHFALTYIPKMMHTDLHGFSAKILAYYDFKKMPANMATVQHWQSDFPLTYVPKMPHTDLCDDWTNNGIDTDFLRLFNIASNMAALPHWQLGLSLT